jgi:phosphomannomutase
MINQTIFKAYDIRGVYPSQLNEEAAYAIGRAFARRSQAKKVTVGMDMRLSGPALKKELIRGITDEGVNVKDIGLVPIDAVYASVGKFGDEAGIMITASHNPKEYNGFKMVLKDMQWIRGTDLMEEAQNLPRLERDPAAAGPEQISETKGTVSEEDIMVKFINHILSFVEVDMIKPFKVVVDAGNGMAGKVIPVLTEGLPLNIIPLNFKLDGNFPAHPSNPLLIESQKELCEVVVKEKADFGVIFDGDTDRLCFVDEKGNFIHPDFMIPLLAEVFLKREPNAGIVYNLTASKIVPETISALGGRPLISKIGYVNMSTVMKEGGGIMGGEVSAHYSFRDNAYADSGFIALVIFLQLLSNHDKPISEIVSPYNKYFKSPETNFEVENKDEILENIKQKYSDGRQSFLDGISVEYPDWWFNVRGSNTEPLLRVSIEANTQEMLVEKQKELTEIIT